MDVKLPAKQLADNDLLVLPKFAEVFYSVKRAIERRFNRRVLAGKRYQEILAKLPAEKVKAMDRCDHADMKMRIFLNTKAS